MQQFTESKVLAFCAGIVVSVFSAGVTFAVWEASHPSKVELADFLGCAAYGSTLEECKVARDAKEARRELMALREDIKDLRKDLARGFGRALTETKAERDEGGKRALRMFQHEMSQGVPPVEAFRRVLESDFP